MKELLQPYIQNAFLLEMIDRAVNLAMSLLIILLLWKFANKAIDRYAAKHSGNQRLGTICAITYSLLKYSAYFLIFVQVLNIVFKINVMSLLAAAGVVGIAVAFGAQSLVKDVITGFFLIFEGEYEVGDIVTIDGFTGTVDSITLRCTTLKSYVGDTYIVPNGSVEKVLNHQKSPHAAVVHVDIAYESDINTAIRVLKECGEKARQEFSLITGEVQVPGVVALGQSGVTLRCLIPCDGGNQYDVEREMLRRIKYAFDENGIEIPYNRLVVINKESEKNK